MCAQGKFSGAAATACNVCPRGTYSGTPGSASCSRCASGYYGDTEGLNVSTCSGPCRNGADCNSVSGPAAGLPAAVPAPGGGAQIINGTYSPSPSISTSQTSTTSPSRSPLRSHTSSVSTSPSTCASVSQTGSITSSVSPSSTHCISSSQTVSITTSALSNKVGYYRPQAFGPAYPCPAGTYGATTQLVTSACTAPCPAGYFCPQGTYNYTFFPCPAGTCKCLP